MRRKTTPRHTTQSRDAALFQLKRLNRGVIVGALVLTALFAEAAAKAFPGRKDASSNHSGHATSQSSTSTSSGNSTLSQPSSTPEAAEGSTGEGETGSSGSSSGGSSSSESSSSSSESTGPVVSGGS